MKLNAEWNAITRTIVPVISPAGVRGRSDREFGSRRHPVLGLSLADRAGGRLILAWARFAQLNTATDDRFRTRGLGLGPTAVALKIAGSWVFGAPSTTSGRCPPGRRSGGVNQMLLQPFVNLTISDAPGRYPSFSPTVTGDW
ncbi:MAG: hypothetical protein IPF73_14990 [Betaproteobacteria bacterium]|nr:hypothetical protein [Betaproteobacteria bacterium]